MSDFGGIFLPTIYHIAIVFGKGVETYVLKSDSYQLQ